MPEGLVFRVEVRVGGVGGGSRKSESSTAGSLGRNAPQRRTGARATALKTQWASSGHRTPRQLPGLETLHLPLEPATRSPGACADVGDGPNLP